MSSLGPISNEHEKPRRILAVASGGGHWVQLQRMMSAFDGNHIVFASTIPSLRGEVSKNRFYNIPDANRRQPIALIWLMIKMMLIIMRERPHFVISTGAAPGYMSLLFGKIAGAQTIWVDSIANVDRLSMSGKLAGKVADLWLTQWPSLAKPEGPLFAGAVL